MGAFFSKLWTLNQVVRCANPKRIADREIPVADFSGKWIIVSGANNGVGYEAAKWFAKFGANLILACREPPEWETHPKAAVEECKSIAAAAGNGNSVIEWWPLELGDLSSVEAFAKRWLDADRPLDVLCNNGGMNSFPKRTKTVDGFEMVHQVNFLSHVLLTFRLLPSLARSSYARILCTTSNLHFTGTFDLEHFNSERGMIGDPYENNKLYFQMWLVELQARLLQNADYKHITINGVHPGFVMSGIWTLAPSSRGPPRDLVFFKFMGYFFGITSQQGGLALVNAATNPELSNSTGAGQGGGKFLNRIWEWPQNPLCSDVAKRRVLWDRVNHDLHLEDKGLLNWL
jgi:NAD(P)-dependent dehydrogenase (short-subunit alcohol dehydrogenase family)